MQRQPEIGWIEDEIVAAGLHAGARSFSRAWGAATQPPRPGAGLARTPPCAARWCKAGALGEAAGLFVGRGDAEAGMDAPAGLGDAPAGALAKNFSSRDDI